MTFDETLYQHEMTELLTGAAQLLQRDHPDMLIFTVSMWTDPNAAVSRVCVDTEEHSAMELTRSATWNKAEYEKLMAGGLTNLARHFAPRELERESNPANFAVRLLSIQNSAFQGNWEYTSEGACWDVLEPALLRAAETAEKIFSVLPLHSNARLAVNSRRDWYDSERPLRSTR